jgi:hypothetical protein
MFYLHNSNMLVSISLFAILSDPELKEWPEFDESKLEQMLSYVAWELDPPDSEDSEEDDDAGGEDLGRWRLI